MTAPGLQRKQGALGSLSAADAAELAAQAAPYAVFDGGALSGVLTEFRSAPSTTSDLRASFIVDDSVDGLQYVLAPAGARHQLRVATTGELEVVWRNGANTIWSALRADVGIVSGERITVRVVLTIATATAQFYISPDHGVTWTLVATLSGGETTIGFIGGTSAIVGAATLGVDTFVGSIYWAEWYRDGVLDLRFDPAEAALSPGAWWGADGRAWTPESGVTFEGITRPAPVKAHFSIDGWGVPGAAWVDRAPFLGSGTTANRILFEPFTVTGKGLRLTRLYCHVGTAGAAGSVARMGVVKLDANGRYEKLLLEPATVSTATTGDKILTVDLVLPPGDYAFVFKAESAGATPLMAVCYDVNPDARGDFTGTFHFATMYRNVTAGTLASTLADWTNLAYWSGGGFPRFVLSRWEAL